MSAPPEPEDTRHHISRKLFVFYPSEPFRMLHFNMRYPVLRHQFQLSLVGHQVGHGYFIIFRTLIRICEQSLEIPEIDKKISSVYQMMIELQTGSH